jgi:lipopolysaccharide transport system ATP-binding protein
MSVVIKVENLSKKYIINHEKKSARYQTLSESLIQGSKNIFTQIKHPFKKSKIEQQTREEFWALKDISFEINQGDKIGIIGRNGAGKSTLLKVLSRITEPTSGKIHINGRIASLLEVGTGFHPELTGAENIYLNGAILGMNRKEIKAKFDEIVDFAEVEKFLDTPVKRYSSGMYVRLAFAVASHLEPDILIVDEVLAVGDSQFQKKCFGKMQDVSKDGRTVMFVSHNIKAIETLCNNCILLNQGMIDSFGKAEIIIDKYTSQFDINEGIINIDNKYLRIINAKAEYNKTHNDRYKIKISIDFETIINIEEMYIDFGLENKNDVRLFQIVPAAREETPISLASGSVFTYLIDFDTIELSPNEYYCTIYAHSKLHGSYLLQSNIFLFRVSASGKNNECMSSGFSAVLLPKYKTNIKLRD